MRVTSSDVISSETQPSASEMLRRATVAIVLGLIAVVICYFFVDRSVAFYVHNHQLNKIDALRLLTLPPPLVQTWSPLVLAILVASAAWSQWGIWRKSLFAACLSLIVADECRESLGSLCGRYWPETWHDNNPSLIGTGTYGFHPFEAGDDTGSFPSGHAARIVGFLSVFWITKKAGRPIYALIALPMLVALVGMNYHFVSDVIAGSVIGWVVGSYAVWLAYKIPTS